MVDNNRIVLDLHSAIDLALETVDMKEKELEHSIFYIVGDPGGGKTRLINQRCADLEYNCICFSPGLQTLEHFSGIPEIVDNGEGEFETVWSVPEFIVKTRKLASNGKPTVIFFDDWHTAPEDIQKIGFELFTYHSYAGHKLPDNSYFILAGNEKSCAGAKIQLTAIKNRMVLLYVKPCVKYWVENFAIPNALLPEGIAFFECPYNGEVFHEAESTSEPFASPRQWTGLFNVIKHIESNGSEISPVIIPALARGCVSSVAATKFVEFLKLYRAVDVETIFRTGKIEIPQNDLSETFVYCIAIQNEFFKRYALSDGDDNCCGIYKKFLTALTKKNSELLIILFRSLIQKKAFNNLKSGLEIFKDLKKKNVFNKAITEKLNNTAENMLI